MTAGGPGSSKTQPDTAAQDPTTAADGTAAQPTDASPPDSAGGVLTGWFANLGRRMRTGELGMLPVVLGLVVIWVIFQSLNDRFLTPQNLSNLTLQIVATALISVGIVLVLLLGEIDLSVGSVSGLTGAIMAVLTVDQNWSPILAIIAALVIGLAVGLFHGVLFARVGVPAFVVTLAGLIGWRGLQLQVLGEQGTINIPYEGTIAGLFGTYFPPAVDYTVVVLVVAAYLLATLRTARRRRAAGLRAMSTAETLLRAGVLAAVVLAAAIVLNQWNGVPLPVYILAAFVVILDLVLRKTRYGRMIFAVGGNAEAARRAGINVTLIRVTVFGIAGTMAAVGGIMATARLFAANQNAGGNDILLLAIAGAVIGGTSLFGGRGSTYSALVGALVIGSITSGMLLLQMSASTRFMITAAVLLIAVILDTVARRGRAASGRA